MSVATRERVDHVDSVERPGRSQRQRLVVVSAVIATLVVIGAPLVAGLLSGGLSRGDGNPALTPMAERVLHSIPGAFKTGDLVVVPAAGNPGTAWTNVVAPELVDGDVVQLDVRGLADIGYLPSRGTAPSWLSEVSAQDRVFLDVGNLSFACTRWPGADTCTGSLLMEHDNALYLFHSGLDVVGTPDEVRSFQVLDLGHPTTMALGVLPHDAKSAMVTFRGGGDRGVPARTSSPGAVGGATLWWVSAPAAVESVRFLDAEGRVLGRADPTG